MLDARDEPAERTRVLNGVAVPGTEFDEDRDEYPGHEETVIDAFRRRVRRGDDVVVVGGGWGTTAVVAARMTHFEGQVTVYEPSSTMRGVLERTLRVNRVADLVSVERAAVGPVSDSSERIFGESDGATVAPADLPACDVMDLDCEGAELAVLRKMTCRPRVLAVEAHPHLGCPRDEVESLLRDRGYDIVATECAVADTDITNYVAVREST